MEGGEESTERVREGMEGEITVKHCLEKLPGRFLYLD